MSRDGFTALEAFNAHGIRFTLWETLHIICEFFQNLSIGRRVMARLAVPREGGALHYRSSCL